MFPKFLESISLNLTKTKRDYLINFKFGHNLLFGIALAITSKIYNEDQESIKKSMLFILDLIVGKDQENDYPTAKSGKEFTGKDSQVIIESTDSQDDEKKSANFQY
jgi:hypothetical protein